MLHLYIANKNYSSWSLRPWLLLKELHVGFTETVVPFSPDNSAFKRISPTGRMPCLDVDGKVVWDSLAIAEYIAEKFDGGWPEDEYARMWARSATAEMHSGFSELREKCPMSVGLTVEIGEQTPALRQDITRVDELWCEGLARWGGPFLTGQEFSVVDAFFAPVAFRVKTYQLGMSGMAARYVRKLLALQSMIEWESAALDEPWRDPFHESQVQRAGIWLQDRRKASE